MGCTKRTAVLMIRHSSRQCSHALYLRIYSNSSLVLTEPHYRQALLSGSKNSISGFADDRTAGAARDLKSHSTASVSALLLHTSTTTRRCCQPQPRAPHLRAGTRSGSGQPHTGGRKAGRTAGRGRAEGLAVAPSQSLVDPPSLPTRSPDISVPSPSPFGRATEGSGGSLLTTGRGRSRFRSAPQMTAEPGAPRAEADRAGPSAAPRPSSTPAGGGSGGRGRPRAGGERSRAAGGRPARSGAPQAQASSRRGGPRPRASPPGRAGCPAAPKAPPPRCLRPRRVPGNGRAAWGPLGGGGAPAVPPSPRPRAGTKRRPPRRCGAFVRRGGSSERFREGSAIRQLLSEGCTAGLRHGDDRRLLFCPAREPQVSPVPPPCPPAGGFAAKSLRSGSGERCAHCLQAPKPACLQQCTALRKLPTRPVVVRTRPQGGGNERRWRAVGQARNRPRSILPPGH